MEENLHRPNDKVLSMRHAIHSLKQQVKDLTIRLERSKKKQEMFMNLSTQRNRELKRMRAHSEWLQKRCDDLIDFIKEKGLKPPFEKKNESDKE